MTPLEVKELPLYHLVEYDAAARYAAIYGKLPTNMGSPGAIDYIQSDPEAFNREVRLWKYALVMQDQPDNP